MFNLKEKVAIITGGAGALGAAMAEGLAREGAKVVILSRTQEKVNSKAQQLIEKGYEAIGIAASVLDKLALEAARDQIMEKWGRIDILVNCAGGNQKGATITPTQSFFDLSLDSFDQVTALNLKGSILPTLVFAKVMTDQGEGSIINISSMAAQQALTRVFGYSASKAAIDNATKWLAVEMAHKFGAGVRVNAIAPGFFIGEQNKRLLLKEDGTYTERAQTIIDNTPMKRFGEPEELIGACNWLASDASRFVTGAIIPVDGGFGAFSGV